MAASLPESEFVGIDLAARPIAAGRELSREIGLQNLRLHELSIEDVSAELGQFDYIIAHGVYSWVPLSVRDKILSICSELLSDRGVAYVSYNTYPGGHLRHMVREMMLFHVQGVDLPEERIAQAKALLTFLADSREESDIFTAFLRSEVERVKKYHDAHLFHDDLAEINAPVYFWQFMEHAGRHRLQFLAEADYLDMQHREFSPNVVLMLESLGDDILTKEQYADFLKCRRFRQTLLCRAEVELNRDPNPETLKDMFLASPLRPVSADADVNSRSVVAFRGMKESSLETDQPVIKAAVLHLGTIWPEAVDINTLLNAIRTQITPDVDDSSDDERRILLSKVLLDAYGAGTVELHSMKPRFVREISEYPRASLLSRMQLNYGTVITTERHVNIQLEDQLGRRLLQLLDGTRSRADLLEELRGLIEKGEISLGNGSDPQESQRLLDGLPEGLDGILAFLAKHAVLVA
jgi:methyltransferase-like protein